LLTQDARESRGESSGGVCFMFTSVASRASRGERRKVCCGVDLNCWGRGRRGSVLFATPTTRSLSSVVVALPAVGTSACGVSVSLGIVSVSSLMYEKTWKGQTRRR
jgi:hypothetical protein